jgi:hypothetical protein
VTNFRVHWLELTNSPVVTKGLQKTLRQGQALVDLMRTGAREHFGADSEKLAEWGIQPFRGRARKEAVKPPENPPAEAPDSSSPTPSPETSK